VYNKAKLFSPDCLAELFFGTLKGMVAGALAPVTTLATTVWPEIAVALAVATLARTTLSLYTRHQYEDLTFRDFLTEGVNQILYSAMLGVTYASPAVWKFGGVFVTLPAMGIEKFFGFIERRLFTNTNEKTNPVVWKKKDWIPDAFAFVGVFVPGFIDALESGWESTQPNALMVQ
jgi:hypothetical protein